MITTPSTYGLSGQGRITVATTVANSPTRTGARGPSRSASRPMTMLFPVSSTPAMNQIAPIAIAPKPSSARRSGPRTPSVPKRSAGRTTSQTERRIRRSRIAAPSMPSGCGSPGAGRRRDRGPRRDAERGDRDDAERPLRTGDRGDAAEHRAEERAGDRKRERLTDQGAAPSRGRRRHEPRERPRPRERAREPLEEAREVELPRLVGKPERGGRRRDAAHADEHRRLDPPPRRHDPARDRTEERAGRVGGRQNAGSGLSEPELVRVVRQQRRQRGEEEGVDEDDRPHEEQHPTHGRE